ncbi:hypothetical protein [Mahella australiensis]|uniref:Uncharacterized protein n=1 Tax=Mahella australiensis (strain DSM 15567 / CIP 107919 / 50-1 BON) TaxID=697281 RepID=F3ZZH0_MAHA5|nr:hypothetical protein [Mahella australiensis]AEE95780.1 hypothetical protein Mahau_0577 [Mahella australiensis 50-1 BON]
MDLVNIRRQHVTWAIEQNPTVITIKRTEKIDAGGYFEEVISNIGPVTVRIFQAGTSIPQDISTLAGTKQIDKSYGLLAGYSADIKACPNVLDEFDAPAGHFIIKAVYPQYVQGQIAGYQADLEKVS